MPITTGVSPSMTILATQEPVSTGHAIEAGQPPLLVGVFLHPDATRRPRRSRQSLPMLCIAQGRRTLMLGATLQGTRCQFRVWAPLAQEVLVEIDGRAAQRTPLHTTGDGYHSAEVLGLRAGQRYKYVVDGKLLPDPCSRYQPEGPHGPSEIVDREAYQWHDQSW